MSGSGVFTIRSGDSPSGAVCRLQELASASVTVVRLIGGVLAACFPVARRSSEHLAKEQVMPSGKVLGDE